MKDRKFVMFTNCKTQGIVDLGKAPLCSDPECMPCSTVRSSIMDYVKNMKKM